MGAGKVTAVGVDFFGVERAVLSVRSDRKGIAVLGGTLGPVDLAEIVGGVPPDNPTALGEILTPKTPGLGDATVGVNEMPGKAEFAVMNVSSPERLLGDRRKYASSIKGLPPRQGHVDAPVVCLVAIPNKRDKKWDPYTAAVRPQLAVGAVDALQGVVPTIRPSIDLRSVAPLRAFFATTTRIRADYAAFVHIDALDLTTVLLSRGEVAFIQRSSGGCLALARNLAAASGQTLEETWTALFRNGLQDFGGVAREEVLGIIDMEVRSLDARLKTIWEANVRAHDRVDPPHIEAVYLSGPLADDDVAKGLDLGGGIEVHLFRPVADLPGVSTEIRRYAGRFTVAYGHAINSIARAGHSPNYALLPADLTPLIDVDLLPAELRAESGMPEMLVSGSPASRSGQSIRIGGHLKPASRRKIAAVMYVGGLSLLGSAGLPMWKRTRIQQKTAQLQDSVRVMSARVLQDSVQLQQFRLSFGKSRAIVTLRELAGQPQAQLRALAAAAGAADGRVWLTQVRVPATSLVIVDGRSASLRSFAAYLDALRQDTMFSSVTYATAGGGGGAVEPNRTIDPSDTAGTFPFSLTLGMRTIAQAPVSDPVTMMLESARSNKTPGH